MITDSEMHYFCSDAARNWKLNASNILSNQYNVWAPKSSEVDEKSSRKWKYSGTRTSRIVQYLSKCTYIDYITVFFGYKKYK